MEVEAEGLLKEGEEVDPKEMLNILFDAIWILIDQHQLDILKKSTARLIGMAILGTENPTHIQEKIFLYIMINKPSVFLQIFDQNLDFVIEFSRVIHLPNIYVSNFQAMFFIEIVLGKWPFHPDFQVFPLLEQATGILKKKQLLYSIKYIESDFNADEWKIAFDNTFYMPCCPTTSEDYLYFVNITVALMEDSRWAGLMDPNEINDYLLENINLLSEDELFDDSFFMKQFISLFFNTMPREVYPIAMREIFFNHSLENYRYRIFEKFDHFLDGGTYFNTVREEKTIIDFPEHEPPADFPTCVNLVSIISEVIWPDQGISVEEIMPSAISQYLTSEFLLPSTVPYVGYIPHRFSPEVVTNWIPQGAPDILIGVPNSPVKTYPVNWVEW